MCMEKQLRILLLEDSSNDAELILLELQKGGASHVSQCVSTRAAFLASLSEFKPDLVLSDYNLPGFTGSEALSLAREQYADIPFILVTGALGDEAAVEIMKSGATDYILKHRLFQLAPSVQRALREADGGITRKRAGQALRESE